MEKEENLAFPILDFPSEACLWATAADSIPIFVSDSTYVAVHTVSRDAEPSLTDLEAVLGARLLVPEVWRDILPKAGLLIPSALSGGTLQQRLLEASEAAPGRCWLVLERVQMRFPLPCPSGCGEKIPREELDKLLQTGSSFYSPELCCRYCYDLPAGIVLYDTEKTWEEKIKLAQSAGFSGALVPSEG